jgi:hypothetical protein
LPTELENGVTCCHALQDKVWVSGADSRWEVYTVIADASATALVAGNGDCRATLGESTAPCCSD